MIVEVGMKEDSDLFSCSVNCYFIMLSINYRTSRTSHFYFFDSLFFVLCTTRSGNCVLASLITPRSITIQLVISSHCFSPSTQTATQNDHHISSNLGLCNYSLVIRRCIEGHDISTLDK